MPTDEQLLTEAAMALRLCRAGLRSLERFQIRTYGSASAAVTQAVAIASDTIEKLDERLLTI